MAGSFTGNKLLDDTRTKDVARFVGSPVMQEKYSKIALDLNAFGDTKYKEALGDAKGDVMGIDPQKVTGWLTPGFVDGLAAKYGVTPEERRAVQTILDGVRNQYKLTATVIVGSHVHALETMLATAVARNTDLRPEPARTAAKLLVDAMQSQDTDINKAMSNLQQFRTIVSDDNVYQRLFDMADGTWQDIRQLERFMSLRMPYFTSEVRPGKFGLFFRGTDGKIESRYFANGEDRNKYVIKNGVDPVRVVDPSDNNWGVGQGMFNQLDDVQKRLQERLYGLFGQEEGDKLASLLDMSAELRNSLNSKDILRLSQPRRLAAGREELNMFDTSQHYVNAVIAAARNRFIRNESSLLFTAPEFDTEPGIKKQIEDHIKMVLTPDSPVGRTLQNVGFLYYLWGNLSSMIMQTSHQVMGLAPTLTSMGQSVSQSFNMIRKANQMVIDSRVKGRYKDPVIQEMVDRLRSEGGIGSWI